MESATQTTILLNGLQVFDLIWILNVFYPMSALNVANSILLEVK